MKISEVTLDALKNYVTPYESSTDDDSLFLMLQSAAVANLCSLTGLPAASEADSTTGIKPPCLDDYEDLTVALFVIVADLYNNRSNTVDKNNANKVVESIVGSHQFNLL